jgi:putative spermidine/putrescine transport system permease protein
MEKKHPVKVPADFQAIPTRSLVFVLLPTLAVMALFFASYGSFVILSFQEMEPGTITVTGRWTLDSYRRFFQDTVYPYFLFQTLFRAAEITVFGMLLAYPLAYCVARVASKVLRQLMMSAMIIPLLVGGITIVYAWLVLLGNAGLVNLALTSLRIVKQPVRFLYSWRGVIICLVYFVLPFAAFSLIGPVRNVPRTLEEAAVNLGASKLTVFLRVVLPLTVPGIVEATSLTYSLSLSAFLFPMMLGGGKVKMMSNIIYESIYVTFDLPFAGALATILLVVSIATVTGMTLLQRTARRAYHE